MSFIQSLILFSILPVLVTLYIVYNFIIAPRKSLSYFVEKNYPSPEKKAKFLSLHKAFSSHVHRKFRYDDRLFYAINAFIEYGTPVDGKYFKDGLSYSEPLTHEQAERVRERDFVHMKLSLYNISMTLETYDDTSFLHEFCDELKPLLYSSDFSRFILDKHYERFEKGFDECFHGEGYHVIRVQGRIAARHLKVFARDVQVLMDEYRNLIVQRHKASIAESRDIAKKIVDSGDL